MDVPQYPPTGFPSPAEEWVEPSLNVHDLLIVHPTTTFFMHVNGTIRGVRSMQHYGVRQHL